MVKLSLAGWKGNMWLLEGPLGEAAQQVLDPMAKGWNPVSL